MKVSNPNPISDVLSRPVKDPGWVKSACSLRKTMVNVGNAAGGWCGPRNRSVMPAARQSNSLGLVPAMPASGGA